MTPARRVLALAVVLAVSAYVWAGCTTKLHTPVTAPVLPGGPTGPLRTPDSVQIIFTTNCVRCHDGPFARAGMQLNADSSYRMIVDHVSIACAPLVRIRPHNPDSSCLMQRITGRVQPQMPLDGPPYLSAADTLTIYRWIVSGAPGTPIVQPGLTSLR